MSCNLSSTTLSTVFLAWRRFATRSGLITRACAVFPWWLLILCLQCRFCWKDGNRALLRLALKIFFFCVLHLKRSECEGYRPEIWLWTSQRYRNHYRQHDSVGDRYFETPTEQATGFPCRLIFEANRFRIGSPAWRHEFEAAWSWLPERSFPFCRSGDRSWRSRGRGFVARIHRGCLCHLRNTVLISLCKIWWDLC